jgi:hypothetical protein
MAQNKGQDMAEGRVFGLDVVEWSVSLLGSALIGLVAWLI